jgi:hypothetical protein
MEQTMSAKEFRKKLGIKEPKIPRKLKKATRHIMTIHHRSPVTSIEGGTVKQYAFVSWETIDGYPYTKWVRKTIAKARNEFKEMLTRELKRQVDEMLQPLDMDEIMRRTEGLKVKLQ